MSLPIEVFPVLLQIWEIKRKRICAIFDGHASIVCCIDFSPDGRFLASASDDGSVRMWCIRDGSSKCLFPSPSRPLGHSFNSVAFSPDGHHLAAGNDDHQLMFWDTRTGHLLKGTHTL
jgi:WD40 repeat protein